MFLIVDDSESFRDLLRLQLGGEAEAAAAGTIAEGLRLAQRLQPSAILLDNWFQHGATGIEAIPAFRAVAPEAPILILTVDEDLTDVARAIGAGAAAYVTKGNMEDVWEALLAVCEITPISRPAEERSPPRLARRVH